MFDFGVVLLIRDLDNVPRYNEDEGRFLEEGPPLPLWKMLFVFPAVCSSWTRDTSDISVELRFFRELWLIFVC